MINFWWFLFWKLHQKYLENLSKLKISHTPESFPRLNFHSDSRHFKTFIIKWISKTEFLVQFYFLLLLKQFFTQISLNAKPLLNQEFYFTFVYTETIIRYNLIKFVRFISSHGDSLPKTLQVDTGKRIENGLSGNSPEDFCAIKSKLETLESYYINS